MVLRLLFFFPLSFFILHKQNVVKNFFQGNTIFFNFFGGDKFPHYTTLIHFNLVVWHWKFAAPENFFGKVNISKTLNNPFTAQMILFYYSFALFWSNKSKSDLTKHDFLIMSYSFIITIYRKKKIDF